jgi:hypothetical protein
MSLAGGGPNHHVLDAIVTTEAVRDMAAIVEGMP